MGSVTNLDLRDSAVYTTNRLNRFITERSNINPNLIIIEETEWSKQDLPSLQDTSKLELKTTINFTKLGCESVHCIGYQYDGSTCLPDTPQQTWTSIDEQEPREYTSCQQVCYSINKSWDKEDPSPTLLPTKFKNGKCLIDNIFSQSYAIAPTRRSDEHIKGTTDVPLFVRNDDGKVQITEQYCSYFGRDFKDGDCYVKPGQAFLERYIFGRTLTALMFHKGDLSGRLDSYTKLVDTRLYLRSKVYQTSLTKKDSRLGDDFWSDYANVELILDMLKDLGFDFVTDKILDGIRYGIKQLIKRIAEEEIFSNMIRLGSKKLIGAVVTGTIIRRTIIDMTLTSAKSIAIQALKMLSMAASIIDIVFTIVTIVSIILDLISIYNLNRQLYQESCDIYTEQFEALFRSAFESFEPTLTPASIIYMTRIPADETDETVNDTSESDEELIESLKQTANYLNSLTVNSLGQVIDWDNSVPGETISPPIADVIDQQNQATINSLLQQNERNRQYLSKYSFVLLPTLALELGVISFLFSKTLCIFFLILCCVLLLIQLCVPTYTQYSFTRCIQFLETRVGQETSEYIQSRLKYFNLINNNVLITPQIIRDTIRQQMLL